MALQGPPPQALPAPGEAPLGTQIMRAFKGVNTQAERSAIPQDTFYDLQNVIPIGPANLHVVPNTSAALHDFSTDTIYAAQFGMVGTTPYLFAYSSQGNIIAYNLSANTAAKINGADTLSSSGVKMTSWYQTYALFIDSTGYYSWNGTTFTKLSLADGPSAGTDICVYGGRVWVSNGRLIVLSAAYNGTSTTDPTNNTAWEGTNGASFLNMTDATLVGNIVRIWPQNGFLYIIGSTCVYVISDIYVPSGASPPTPVYTLTAIQSIIGTDQPFAVFPYNRALMFCSRYGVWAIQGVQAQRISADIDGTFQYLTFTQQVSGGQCIIHSILNAAFLVQRQGDPVLGSGTVIAMWFDSKWWFANVGNAAFIASVVMNAEPVLMAIIGNKLYQLFEDTTTCPDTQVMTPLWDMSDPISDKLVVRAGVELIAEILESTSNVSVTLDTFNGSTPFGALTSFGSVAFVNTNGGLVQFTGTASAAIFWTVGNYQLYQGYPPGMWSKYVGLTLTSSGITYELDSFLMDFKLRKRW